MVGFAGCAMLVLLASGCGGVGPVVMTDKDNFQTEVLGSGEPVLVDFYKDDCLICAPLIPVMDDLSKEYQGRVKVARFMIMSGYFTLPAPEIKEKYQIFYVPTVILFDKGVEIKRWDVVYSKHEYEKEIDRLLAGPITPSVAK
jgi:thioredoxin 1